MRITHALIAIALATLAPAFARAEGHGRHGAFDLPWWSILPFALLLCSIALMPILTEHWWHRNSRKALLTLFLSTPVLVYLAWLNWQGGLPALELLQETALEYLSFVALLGSLYVVSGGIVIAGHFPCKPTANAAFLTLGALLANIIGTTGASVLLIRPLLRANRARSHHWHLIIFFIILVGNTGGLLTPLGDPPLFLGFLDGVPFAWTLGLWKHWLFVNCLILAIFLVWDSLVYKRLMRLEKALEEDRPQEKVRVLGVVNLFLLAGIIGAVLLQGRLAGPWRTILPPALMVLISLCSLWLTPDGLRVQNAFSWDPILEVAILFAGIFITMIPALQILGAKGGMPGEGQAWHYFWITGLLSSCLDNAPTYLTFGSLASKGNSMGWLVDNNPLLLQAISCGAVFMGALTYIGNGPNFMIKAIANEAGYKTPSFFGYILVSCLLLLPVFVMLTFIFFRP
jgi:Na+/H+ antiporter NhaD/arsenite permease-like protein